MIIVGSYESPEQAHVVLGRLHAEEIPAALLNEYAIGNQWGIGLAAGGVCVQVRPMDVDRARQIIVAAADIPDEEMEDADPYSGYCCPRCDSTKVEYRRCSLRAFCLSILIVWVPLPLIRPRLRCLGCGHHWKRGTEAAEAKAVKTDESITIADLAAGDGDNPYQAPRH